VNENVLILILIWMSFFMGMIPILLIGRGLFGKYINAFFTGRPLIVVHLKRGGVTFRLGVPVVGAPCFAYTLWKKDDIKIVSTPSGCVLPAGKVKFIHVEEENTDPFLFEKFVYVAEKIAKPKLDKDGNPVIDEKTGNYEIVESQEVKLQAFQGFNDSGIIRQLYRWALLRPSVKLNGINIRGILIGLIVIVVAIVILTQLGGGAPNVIN